MAEEFSIKSAPASFRDRLRYLGPSLIVTANIVGAGELIMTTTLGAKAGFIALWVILISCMVKVTIQIEFGRHAITTGETTLEAFAKLPGPKLGRGHWSVWTWLLIKSIQFVQMGGMIGGVALALNIAIPLVPVWTWAWLVAFLTIYLVRDGKYARIEKIAVYLVAIFSVFTLICLFFLNQTPYAITWSEIASGLTFQMPAAVLGVALAAFGITGVSSDEAISYPYWCVEKGYAKFAGENDRSKAWQERASGWIRLMYLDAFISMLIYTLTTAGFFLLGAAILYKTGNVPEGYSTISTLSEIYTESVGPGAKFVFLVGAVLVLFSSLVIGAASNQRMFTDAFAQLGLLNYRNDDEREKWFRFWAWFLPLAWVTLFTFIQAPVFMVMLGGIVLTILLLVVVYAALHFRHGRLDKSMAPSRIYDVIFWLSAILIFAFCLQALYKFF